MENKLNIAIILDNKKLMKYQKEIFEMLLLSEYCTVTYVIYKQSSPKEDKHKFSYFLYAAYKKFDRFVFGRGLQNLHFHTINDLIKNIKEVYLPIVNKGEYDYISQNNMESLVSYDIDVMVDFSKYITIGTLSKFPKYGLWRLMHTYEPAGFWEVIESQPYTEMTLQKISDTLSGGVIIDSYRTITDQKSPLRNLDIITWRSHMLIEQNLKKLYNNQDTFLKNKVSHITFPDKLLSSELRQLDVMLHYRGDERKIVPNNYQMIGILFKVSMKFCKIFFRKYFTKFQWSLMYIENDTKEINFSLLEYKKLLPPRKDLFWADPFVIDEGEKSYIFYEEFSSFTKGILCVIVYDAAQKIFSDPKEIMNQEYHLSYPFIFNYNGAYYMIPETAQNKTIDLYKAKEFPYKWEKIKSFFNNIVAVDTMIHYYNNKWWMFTNITPKDGFSNKDELYIYYCDNFLEDEWMPHVLNPVITDVTVARNAGKIIEKEGVLYRPSQYCGGSYGRLLNINKIETLNELEYKETLVGRTSTCFDEGLEGMHTLNSSKRLTIIDVATRWFSFK